MESAMTNIRRLLAVALVPLAALFLLTPAPVVYAYVEAPHSLGQVVTLSSNIVLMRVAAVDRTKNAIIYTKVRDVKGVHKQPEIRHNIGKAGFEPREWQTIMNWAEVGKEALFFHNGGQSETCTGMYWYQCYGNANDPNSWWGMTHGEPFLLRTFAGKISKLVSACTDVIAGKEVIVPCMVDGNKDDLKSGKARIQRCRASLKLDYNQKRDFVGWGGEDFRPLSGMPGFTHISALARVDPDAQSISAIDFNGDGKPDLCLAGAGRVALLQNAGDSLNESSLPGATGCRAAVWADYNGDGLPDLLLATPTGPRLYTNLGAAGFRDDTHLLPREPGYNLTCAAWIDQDGDGRPDILLGNGFHGLRLYRNRGKAQPLPKEFKPGGRVPEQCLWFADVSDTVGLGEMGIGSRDKGDTLTVVDIDGDGKPDFLYGAATGIVARNTGDRFEEMKNTGIAYETGKVGPVFADFNHDGRPDLFVPQRSGCKLFRNDGSFKFTEVTREVGLGKITARTTCAAWGDVDNDGYLDLVIGCFRGPNLYFRNKGDGTFEDAGASLGLDLRVFNTQAICLVDLNNDGVLDMVFNNEGQDSVVLLANKEVLTRQTPVTLQLAAKLGVTGSRVSVRDAEGKLRGSHQVSGGEGRGGQSPPTARFALPPGKYRVEVRFSSGEKRARELLVAGTHVNAVLDEKMTKVE
jgi:hypothetical protein